MSPTARIAVLLGAALALACARTPARTFQVGEQRVEVVVPAGWEALDHGRQIIFRTESARLILADLGPGRPEGFRAEVVRTRDLWRDARDDEARTRLGQLPLRTDLFTSREELDRIREPWSAVLSAPRGTAYEGVSTNLARLIAAIDEMQPVPIGRIVVDVLPRLGHDERRWEVKSRRDTRVDGREAMVVETWMALTHSHPRRVLVVLNEGRVLALDCDRCEGAAADAFDRIAASVHFAEESRK